MKLFQDLFPMWLALAIVLSIAGVMMLIYEPPTRCTLNGAPIPCKLMEMRR